MKSEWKVTSNFIIDKKMYAVYRIIDASAVDHSENREYATPYLDDKKQCLEIAKSLNEERK